MRGRLFSLLLGIDWFFLLIPLFLAAAGIAVIYSLAPIEADKTPLALSQGIYVLVGIAVMLFLSLLDYRILRALAPFLYGIGLFLIVLVLFVGSEQFGARRWLDLGPFQLQPSELMKLFVVTSLAWFFTGRDETKISDIVAAIILVVLPAFLVGRQPDFGTAILLFLGSLPIFLFSKIRREQWLGLIAAVIVAIPVIFASLKPYQIARVESFINPASDPFGAGYTVLQSQIAIGSGGLIGRGLGQGSQSTLQFVPVAHTDFIFAGVAEASGLLGSAILLILFALVIGRAIRLGFTAQDRFGRLLSLGFASIWLFSVFINVGMNLGIAPVTGIPLPFVSFGGSSLITNFAMAGILESIHFRQKKISFR